MEDRPPGYLGAGRDMRGSHCCSRALGRRYGAAHTIGCQKNGHVVYTTY